MQNLCKYINYNVNVNSHEMLSTKSISAWSLMLARSASSAWQLLRASGCVATVVDALKQLPL